MALRCTVTDYKQLATTVAELQAEVVRDRSTAQTAVDTAGSSDFRCRESRGLRISRILSCLP